MFRQNHRMGDLLNGAAFSYERWRENFLRFILRGTCILGLAVLAFSIFDTLHNGRVPLIAVYSFAWTALLIVTFSRWPYWIRAGTFLFILYALGVSGLLEAGMRGDARTFFFFASVMAALLVEPLVGMAVLGLCVATIAGFAPFAVSGRIHLLSKVTVAGNADLWIMSSLEFFAFGMAILIGLNLLLREFRAAQSRVADVVADLTRERARLRESEKRYRMIFHRSPVSLWEEDISELREQLRVLRERGVVDLASYLEQKPDFLARAIRAIKVIDVNDATLHLYRAEGAEQLAGPLDRTLESSAFARFSKLIVAIAEGRRKFEQESTAKTLTGDTIHVLVSSSIPDESDPYQRMLVNVFDIGERKRAETEKRTLEEELVRAQKMESIGRLAASVAHDVNNLLGPILGFAEVLLHRLPPEDSAKDDLEQIEGAALRARNLTQQLLAMGGKQHLKLQSIDLRDVVAGFMKILRRSIHDTMRIELTLPESLGRVMADTGQIEQVLLNLALNAQDAMEDGGILTIALSDSPTDAQVILTVADTGHGMDAATKEHIFEPFFTKKTRGKGTGLGLATVYGIIAQHGGSIRVDSTPGEGSTFTVQLPRYQPQTPEAG
jgi:signal transduction histidine kinase